MLFFAFKTTLSSCLFILHKQAKVNNKMLNITVLFALEFGNEKFLISL